MSRFLSVRCENVLLLMLLGLSPLAHADAPTTSPSTAPATTQAAKPKHGEILELTNNSITAMPLFGPRDNERGRPKTYTLDDETRVYISTLTEERTNEKGQMVKSYKVDRVTRDDLKVGQLARIDADGDRAMRVTIMPDEPEKPKKSK